MLQSRLTRIGRLQIGRSFGSYPGEKLKPVGAGHASEIEYCMGNLYLVDDFAWTKDDYKVSETMQNYFANFIKTGNPNGSNQPDWPASQSTDLHPPVMVLDANTRVEKAPNDGRYMFLDKMYKNNN